MIDFLAEPKLRPVPQRPASATSPPESGWTETVHDWSEFTLQRVRLAVMTQPKLTLFTAFIAGGALAWLTSRK